MSDWLSPNPPRIADPLCATKNENMNFIRKLFKPHKLNDVFTPNTVAKLNYISRKTLEKDLEKYISLPGKQIILYGHSGSGKTTLIRNKLKELSRNYLRTHCEAATTFNDLLLQAFDSLNHYYISEKSAQSKYEIKAELKTEYNLIKSKISTKISQTEGESAIRIVPPQLTPQKLSEFLGEIDCIWIIEDFHKVANTEKKRIADVIKIFVDAANDYNKVKIICIGAVGTARELIELDDNLATRVAELYVPLLEDDEICKVAKNGCSLLNIKMNENLLEKITYYSNNLGALAHQICYDVCYDKKIEKTIFLQKELNEDVFKVAVDSYVRKNSDTFAKLYDKVVSEDCGWSVLKAFEQNEKVYLSFNEIKNEVKRKIKINDEELQNLLISLGTPGFNELVRYDRTSQKYSLSSPFFSAFLKMKIALEQKEQKEIKDKQKKKSMAKYSLASKTSYPFVIDESFINDYYQLLTSRYMLEEKRKTRKIPPPKNQRKKGKRR